MTTNTEDIWNASNLRESKKLLQELKKEIVRIREWHDHWQTSEELKNRIANGDRHVSKDFLRAAEIERDLLWANR